MRGVINLCDEYRGPKSEYEKLGMEELRLKTVDHFVPSLEDLKVSEFVCVCAAVVSL